ncbi:MAG: hypothetical protein IPL21_07420 [Saprospirales bacterium]|nr:hypothetical protein [Saprospirales bacterium]
MNIHAIGQNMLYGKVGHFFIIVAFVTSLAACLSYLFATLKRDKHEQSFTWINFARKLFILHAVAVVGIVAMLLLVIHQHLFEYKYVWETHHDLYQLITSFQPCGAAKKAAPYFGCFGTQF